MLTRSSARANLPYAASTSACVPDTSTNCANVYAASQRPGANANTLRNAASASPHAPSANALRATPS